VDNEIEILKSRTLVQRVVKKLNLNTSFLVEGRVVIQKFTKSPIEVYFMDKTNQFYESKIKLKFSGLTPDKFSLVNEVSENAQRLS
jgi:hypothetical protein